MLQECREPAECYGQISMERGSSRTRVLVYERKSAHVMAANPAGLLPGQGSDEEHLDMTILDEALPSISVRCVECSALYPLIEAGRPMERLSGQLRGVPGQVL